MSLMYEQSMYLVAKAVNVLFTDGGVVVCSCV